MTISKVAVGDVKEKIAPSANGETEIKEDDARYFKLSKPIMIGNQTVSRLLVDSGELSGATYFKIVGRFRKEYPEIYRTSLNKLSEETFMSYVVAELNPPMAPEDVAKVSFKDLPILFLSLLGFVYGAKQEPATEEK